MLPAPLIHSSSSFESGILDYRYTDNNAYEPLFF